MAAELAFIGAVLWLAALVGLVVRQLMRGGELVTRPDLRRLYRCACGYAHTDPEVTFGHMLREHPQARRARQ